MPAGLTPGQHVVRVQSSVNSSVFADSAEITVECAGSAPAISEVAVQQLIWHGGSRQQVTWSSQGEVPAVRISLYEHATSVLGLRDQVKTLVSTRLTGYTGRTTPAPMRCSCPTA